MRGRAIIKALLQQGRGDLARVLAAEWRDRMPGGLGDETTPDDVDPEQLRMGVKVEMEHTNDPDTAKEIALDHLTEDPAYYTKLATIEGPGAHAMNQELQRAIAATLKKAGRTDLAGHFVRAQPSRLDKVLMKHKQNVLSDLRLLITKSGVAPGAQKNALQAVTQELSDSFGRINKLVSGL